jgi:ubiquitin-protein ligase E3 A
MLNFQINLTDSFESVVNFNLIENGDQINVTKENREVTLLLYLKLFLLISFLFFIKKQFVQLYTDFILNKSIEDKFQAFRRGFLNVTRTSPLSKWYLPEELEILICGSKVSFLMIFVLFKKNFYSRNLIGNH